MSRNKIFRRSNNFVTSLGRGVANKKEYGEYHAENVRAVTCEDIFTGAPPGPKCQAEKRGHKTKPTNLRKCILLLATHLRRFRGG